jgi:hypothetical protein
VKRGEKERRKKRGVRGAEERRGRVREEERRKERREKSVGWFRIILCPDPRISLIFTHDNINSHPP